MSFPSRYSISESQVQATPSPVHGRIDVTHTVSEPFFGSHVRSSTRLSASTSTRDKGRHTGRTIRNAFRQYRLSESLYSVREPPRTAPFRYSAAHLDDGPLVSPPFGPEHVRMDGYEDWVQSMESRVKVLQQQKAFPSHADSHQP